jgi:hypothetical protein
LSYNSLDMAEGQGQGRRRDRPTSVTLANWGVFLLGLANGWRAAGLYRQSDLLLDLDAALDPRLQMFLALVWAALFLTVAVALRQGRPFVRIAIPALIVAFGSYQLVFLRAYTQTPEARSGRLAIGLLYGLAILFTIWTLNRRPARAYFNRQS